MENTTCMSVPDAAFGKSRGTDCDTTIFATTMKMMRSTSVMSTSGVTLMPTMPSSVSPCDILAISTHLRFRYGLQVREKDAREDLGVGERRFDEPLERVVSGDGRNRDEKPDGGGDQSLGDAGHDRLRSDGGRDLRCLGPGRLSQLVE